MKTLTESSVSGGIQRIYRDRHFAPSSCAQCPNRFGTQSVYSTVSVIIKRTKEKVSLNRHCSCMDLEELDRRQEAAKLHSLFVCYLVSQFVCASNMVFVVVVVVPTICHENEENF